jgi:hypothetical protein
MFKKMGEVTMKIYSVSDPEFTKYGRVFSGMETECKAITKALKHTPLPKGTGLCTGRAKAAGTSCRKGV